MRLLVLLVVACLMPWPAIAATQVVMKNGDRLSGTLINKIGESLTLDTRYAGTVKLRWSEIAEILSDVPIEVMRADGTLEQVTFGAGDYARHADAEYLNPDAARAGRGTVFDGRVNLSLNVTDGNSENERLYGELELKARAQHHRYRLGARGTRASERDTLTASNWLADGQYDRFLGDRRFAYARTSFQNDRFRDLRLRSTLGAGLGYQIIDTPDTQLSIQAGPDYVVEDRYGREDESYGAAGWGIRYAQWLWSRRLQIFHEQDGFWSLEETDDVVVRTRTGLRLPVTGELHATAQLNLDYDNTPALGRTSTDRTWLLGLGYTF